MKNGICINIWDDFNDDIRFIEQDNFRKTYLYIENNKSTENDLEIINFIYNNLEYDDAFDHILKRVVLRNNKVDYKIMFFNITHEDIQNIILSLSNLKYNNNSIIIYSES